MGEVAYQAVGLKVQEEPVLLGDLLVELEVVYHLPSADGPQEFEFYGFGNR